MASLFFSDLEGFPHAPTGSLWEAPLFWNFLMMCCMYICVQGCAHEQKAEEGISFPGVGLTGSCELTNVVARNQTLALCKSSSEPLSHL